MRGFDSGSFVKVSTHYEDIIFAEAGELVSKRLLWEARGEKIATEVGHHLGRQV